MKRDEMIDILIKDDLESWFDRDDKDSYFAYIMRNGFRGYKQYSDSDLFDELVDRELIEVEND